MRQEKYKYISIKNTLVVYQTYCIDTLYVIQFNAQNFRCDCKDLRESQNFKVTTKLSVISKTTPLSLVNHQDWTHTEVKN